MGYLLPTCALFFSILLCIIYFSKKRINLLENKVYSSMIIIIVFASLIESFLQIITLNGVDSFDILLANLLNRINFILIINYFFCLFLYIILITNKTVQDILKKYTKQIIILKWIVSVILLCLKINVIEYKGYFSITGNSVQMASIICFIYLIMSLLIAIKNIKKYDKRYIPVFAIFFLLIFAFIIFKLNPYIIIISISFTFVNYIMYFTIENPDVVLLQQMKLAKNEAEKANRAKSDFLSSMSHEIRTPLNVIVGFSEDLKNYKDTADPRIVKDADYILEASQKLLELVGNILDINKIESNKIDIVEVPYNLKNEIESLIKLIGFRIDDKNINLKVDIDPNTPYELIGDKKHIKQIINNLLTNAIKYTKKGEILLNVKCNKKDNMCDLIISIKDTGQGIKGENINKLFNKFERLDVYINSTTEGVGLGLAITKSLVELLGGKISVESEINKGSLFTVKIPQIISQLDNKKEDNTIANNLKINNTKDKKVLIVDDNKLNIKVARKALEGFEFIIDECYDGLECLNKVIKGNEYDLILMDIMMPNMNGEDTLVKLKENPNFKIPTIALTADAVAGAKEKYLSGGFTDYIAKPFTKEQIKEKIDFLFNK